MSLPANSTFLPVLDDLLSPDLRPILQTPTAECGGICASQSAVGPAGGGGRSGFANVISTSDVPSSAASRSHQQNSTAKKINFKAKGANSRTLPDEERASRKIQHWWRTKFQRRHSSDLDLRAERAKHTLRHNRTEDHVIYLETEVSRLKSALTAERRARSLQTDAIRCLWSQVQQMSTPGPESVMTQSMPNGLSSSPLKRQIGHGKGDSQMSVSFAGPGVFQTEGAANVPSACTSNCSKEIQLLRESMSAEISQLREMLSSLRMEHSSSTQDNQQRYHMEVDTEDTDTDTHGQLSTSGILSGASVTSDINNGNGSGLPQRPFSLNILGMTTSGSSATHVDMETPEITEFAGAMARDLLEEAVEREEEATQQRVNCRQ